VSTASVTPVTVLLVDDHAVVREGYRRLLERSAGVTVVGEASDAQSAYLKFVELAPEVVVMDFSLPGASGIDALRRMKARTPAARVLMFSMHEDVVFARRALQAGAMGYVTKGSAPDELVGAILRIADGQVYLESSIAQQLAVEGVTGEPDASAMLSAREFEVLRLLVRGVALKDIAQQLGLTQKTVANHQSAIRQKLGADNAIQLLQAAARLGLEPG
jgi:two-component system, NarL family, invasion response regulator UvrY